MFARKLQYPRQNRKKLKFLWEQALSHRYLHLVLDRIHILLYEYIYFYANLCTNTVEKFFKENRATGLIATKIAFSLKKKTCEAYCFCPADTE